MLHISKRNPLPITVNNQNIRYVRNIKLLGLNIKSNGITAHIKEQRFKASMTLKKLRRFRKFSSKTKLHLYKALILPIIDYPVIPMNTLRPTNWKKLQAIQNKALRWINGDTPPYHSTIQALHTKYGLETINTRNFRLAYSMWEKIRMEFPVETNDYQNATFNRTHAWWPLAYMSEEAVEPRPIFGNIGARDRNQQQGNHNDNNEDDEEEE